MAEVVAHRITRGSRQRCDPSRARPFGCAASRSRGVLADGGAARLATCSTISMSKRSRLVSSPRAVRATNASSRYVCASRCGLGSVRIWPASQRDGRAESSASRREVRTSTSTAWFTADSRVGQDAPSRVDHADVAGHREGVLAGVSVGGKGSSAAEILDVAWQGRRTRQWSWPAASVACGVGWPPAAAREWLTRRQPAVDTSGHAAAGSSLPSR